MVTPQWELLHTGLFCCGSFFHRSICLSLGKADFFLVGIYFQNLHVDDFANLQFIFGFYNVLVCNLGNVYQTIYAGFQFNECTEGYHTNNLTLNDGANCIFVSCQLPRVLVCILQGQADFALFLIYIQNEYFNFLTLLQNLSVVGNSAPAHFGNVNQAIYAAQNN